MYTNKFTGDSIDVDYLTKPNSSQLSRDWHEFKKENIRF